MDNYVLIYQGNRSISALRSIRRFTGLSLKEAKGAIDNPMGFIVSETVADNILKDYMFTGINATLSTVLDWSVELHTGPLPIYPDLRNHL